ncbi:MAG TPA: helix-turn-helix domain-containing protein [Thermoleophilaceae bacterium]|nr:helix-turn-helix domain-containing protein [Thermoleophilaceae bacterium]
MSTQSKRPYKKRRRAELEAETRLRITEAAVDLHGSVGPARTTISAVAERAGVQRATVYRHFPDEEALFQACSSHWAAQHALPDPEGWAAIDDPDERLGLALRELYDWYESAAPMLERTTRDAPLVPSMQPVMDAFAAWFGGATEALVRGRPERGARRRHMRAAVGHALAFATWRSLVREQGLATAEAVALMEGLVRCLDSPPSRRRSA